MQISWHQIPIKLFDNAISHDHNCKRLFHYFIIIVLFKSLKPIKLYDCQLQQLGHRDKAVKSSKKPNLFTNKTMERKKLETCTVSVC